MKLECFSLLLLLNFFCFNCAGWDFENFEFSNYTHLNLFLNWSSLIMKSLYRICCFLYLLIVIDLLLSPSSLCPFLRVAIFQHLFYYRLLVYLLHSVNLNAIHRYKFFRLSINIFLIHEIYRTLINQHRSHLLSKSKYQIHAFYYLSIHPHTVSH